MDPAKEVAKEALARVTPARVTLEKVALEKDTTICRCPERARLEKAKVLALPRNPPRKGRKRVQRKEKVQTPLPVRTCLDVDATVLAFHLTLLLSGFSGQPSAPSAPSPITPSPTSANSIPIRATPFALFYDGDFDRIPNDDEFAEVADVTRLYLEEFMIKEFEQTSLTNLDDFLTFMIRNSFEFGEPVQADYRCTGLFNPDSIFLPTVRELNSLLDDAFEDDNLDAYIDRVQDLPNGNIFSTTRGVLKGLPDVPVPRTPDGTASGGSTFRMGLAAAAAGIVVLAAGAAMLKRNRSEEELEDPYGDNLKGDAATLAGETCSASLESSEAWRKSSPYVTDLSEYDDEDFQDEPLDSDEELESSRRQRGKAPPQAAFSS